MSKTITQRISFETFCVVFVKFYSFICLHNCPASIGRFFFCKLHNVNIKAKINFSRSRLPLLQRSCWDQSSLATLLLLPWLLNGSAIFLIILSQLYLSTKSHRFNIQRGNQNYFLILISHGWPKNPLKHSCHFFHKFNIQITEIIFFWNCASFHRFVKYKECPISSLT